MPLSVEDFHGIVSVIRWQGEQADCSIKNAISDCIETDENITIYVDEIFDAESGEWEETVISAETSGPVKRKKNTRPATATLARLSAKDPLHVHVYDDVRLPESFFTIQDDECHEEKMIVAHLKTLPAAEALLAGLLGEYASAQIDLTVYKYGEPLRWIVDGPAIVG